jgi:hypothetical protein
MSIQEGVWFPETRSERTSCPGFLTHTHRVRFRPEIPPIDFEVVAEKRRVYFPGSRLLCQELLVASNRFFNELSTMVIRMMTD